MLNDDDVLEHADDVVAQDAGEERVLVPLRTDVADLSRVWNLNRTAARVWDLVDGSRTVADVVTAVVARYDVPPETARAEVRSLLTSMLSASLMRRR